jgi:hypothetical protein
VANFTALKAHLKASARVKSEAGRHLRETLDVGADRTAVLGSSHLFQEAHGQCGPEALEWSVLAPAKISAPNSKTGDGVLGYLARRSQLQPGLEQSGHRGRRLGQGGQGDHSRAAAEGGIPGQRLGSAASVEFRDRRLAELAA